MLQAGDCAPQRSKVRETEVPEHACPYNNRGACPAWPGEVGTGASHTSQHSGMQLSRRKLLIKQRQSHYSQASQVSGRVFVMSPPSPLLQGCENSMLNTFCHL